MRPDNHRVFDCFMFFNELEVLEIRMNELSEVVDFFVIVESTITHSGKPREAVFLQYMDEPQFAPFKDRIIYKVLVSSDTLLPPSAGSWEIERAQRNHIHPLLLSGETSWGVGHTLAFQAPDPEDILMVSDVDEIPKADAVRRYDPKEGVCKFDMSLHYYYLNRRVSPAGWQASFILPFGEVCHVLSAYRAHQALVIEDGGWHFSYMGGAERIREKLLSFAHTEFSGDHLTGIDRLNTCLENRQNVLGGADEQPLITMEELPEYILSNPDKFETFLVPDDAPFRWKDIEGWWDDHDADYFRRIIDMLPDGSHLVEIGCWQGRSTCCIAGLIRDSGKTLKHDAVDTWQGSKQGLDTEMHAWKISELEAPLYEVFLDNLVRAGVSDRVRPIRSDSAEAAALYEDESVDFVFVDGCHEEEAVRLDVTRWLPKVKIGGHLAGHDWGRDGVTPGVTSVLGGGIEVHGFIWMYKKNG